jgi:hypothetical protein
MPKQVVYECPDPTMPDQLQIYSNSKPVRSIILFNITDLENSHQLPSPSPPPKLHYSTFWRSVARRIYYKHLEETKQSQLGTRLRLREVQGEF